MNTALHRLMQGLYYPAVTGSGIVLVLYRATMHSSFWDLIRDFSIGYGFLALLLFSANFLAICRISPLQYTSRRFVIDALEICAAFAAFYFLGLFDTMKIAAPDLRLVYLCMTVLALLSIGWTAGFTRGSDYLLWAVRIGLLALGGAGFLWLYSHLWFNVVAFYVCCGLISLHFFGAKKRGILDTSEQPSSVA